MWSALFSIVKLLRSLAAWLEMFVARWQGRTYHGGSQGIMWTIESGRAWTERPLAAILRRTETEQIIDLRMTLPYMGVPVNRSAMFGDNQSQL